MTGKEALHGGNKERKSAASCGFDPGAGVGGGLRGVPVAANCLPFRSLSNARDREPGAALTSEMGLAGSAASCKDEET